MQERVPFDDFNSITTARPIPAILEPISTFGRRALIDLIIFVHFCGIVFGTKALFQAKERRLIAGKLRRVFLGLFPPLTAYLQKKHGLSGACNNCGTSCRILFQCPLWDDRSRLCSVYEDRPTTCRLFPITPADLRDRDAVSDHASCGYSFVRINEAPLASAEVRQP